MQESTIRSAGLFATVIVALLLLVLGGVYFVKSREAAHARSDSSQQEVASGDAAKPPAIPPAEPKSPQPTPPAPTPSPGSGQQQPSTTPPAAPPATPPAPSQQPPAPSTMPNTGPGTMPATGPTETIAITAGLVAVGAYFTGRLLRARRLTRQYVRAHRG